MSISAVVQYYYVITLVSDNCDSLLLLNMCQIVKTSYSVTERHTHTQAHTYTDRQLNGLKRLYMY